jgi:hypothetical protein
VSTRSRGLRFVAVAKDVLSFCLAWGIIYQQVLIGPADNRFLALAAIFLGVPGASAVLPRLLGAVGASTSTTSPDSASASSDSRS